MLTLDARLCPNDDEIAAEILDGEAIIINLATGSYYSMGGAGGMIWHGVEQHCCLEEIAARVAVAYEVSLERARVDVLDIAGRLLAEGIAKPSAAAAFRGEAPLPLPSRLPYETPLLSAYADMRNLLALDPPIPSIDALERGGPKGSPPDESGRR